MKNAKKAEKVTGFMWFLQLCQALEGRYEGTGALAYDNPALVALKGAGLSADDVAEFLASFVAFGEGLAADEASAEAATEAAAEAAAMAEAETLRARLATLEPKAPKGRKAPALSPKALPPKLAEAAAVVKAARQPAAKATRKRAAGNPLARKKA